MFAHLFPHFGNRNILLYYLMGIFLNGWFILPNWVFYFSRYLSLSEVGLVEGVAVLVGILMEVPSGVLSDMLGKRKTIIFGSLCLIASCVILINARELIDFLIGNVMMFIGFSFQSGATEAFAYDSLLAKKQEKNYSTVAAKYGVIVTVMTVLSTLTGGYLYSLRPEYTFYAWIVFLTVSLIISYIAVEPKIDSVKFSVSSYLRHLREGVGVLFGKSLRLYLVPVLALPILIKLYQGIVRQSSGAYFGYTGETFGYLIALIMIPAVLISYKFDVIVGFFREKKLLLFTISLYLVGFVLAYMSNAPLVGGIVFLLLMSSEKLVLPLVSLIINERIDSKHRATTLSTLSLVTQLPYVILVMQFAWLTEAQNIPKLYLLYIGFIALVIWKTLNIKKV